MPHSIHPDHICFIASGFPSRKEPSAYIFLAELIHTLADMGVRCTVIQPVSLTRYMGRGIPPAKEQVTTSRGSTIEIHRPRFVSFSARRFGGINTAGWTLHEFTRAAARCIRARHMRPDALYGHFIYPSGLAVALLGREFGIPAFCAVGEGEPWTITKLGPERTRQLLNRTPALFAVSQSVKKMLVEHGLEDEKNIAVFPNGVDRSQFHPMDRSAMRKKFGFPQDAFILAFIGNLSEGKGYFRLVEALRGLPDVHAFFLGSGVQRSDPGTTLYTGLLAHAEVPQMLNTADIFVLPTLIEGCPNAVIEALACGLPVISSNYAFNDDILNDACSIRVDPLDVSAIRSAIQTLKDDSGRRQSMSQAALEKTAGLDIHLRAGRILAWMGERMGASGVPGDEAV